MIKAIREDRKTVTRRKIDIDPLGWVFKGMPYGIAAFDHKGTGERITMRPRYQVGETVYIKETLFRHPYLNEAGYILDGTPVFINQTIGDCLKWRWTRDILSAMFMPKEAARYFITITGVEAKRLQDLTEEDAQAEGATRPPNYSLTPHYREWFKWLWDSINAKRVTTTGDMGTITGEGYPWETNPWVFVYSFIREG